MRTAHLLPSLVALAATFSVPAQGKIYKIMPLGDSITSARKSPPVEYGDIASYRYFLWHQLLSSGRNNVDFVGSQTMIPAVNKPQYNNFDMDHEGKWFRRADQMATLAAGLVATAQPDIILLHAGSVDLSDGQDSASTLTDIGNIIDEARKGKPDVKILLAKIIPFAAGPYFADVEPLNALLPGLAASKNTPQSPVILVDHFTGWNPAIHTWDGVHPYEAGEVLMADNWFQELAKLIPTVVNTAPVAAFEGSPLTGNAPLQVAFVDQSTGTPSSWLWEFGDGSSSSLQSPSHSYAAPGNYTVRLTVTNINGSDNTENVDYVSVYNIGAGSSADPLRIMPLGDSITEARDGYATYRYFLWHKLQASGHCVDFVGSMVGTQGRNGVGHDGKPKYNDFDWDHEGHWGLRADEIAAQAFNWARAANPDLVLLHAGSNDIFQGQTVPSTVADLKLIFSELRRANPRIQIFIAQIIPPGPKFPFDVTALNAELPILVAAESSAQSPITLVDQFTGWDPALHSIDDVHPNVDGEARMATKWHNALLAENVPTCNSGPTDVKIMPFGDSITEARVGRASYRYFLWHQLQASGHCVDFVGSNFGVHAGAPKYGDFDQDHEGWEKTSVDEMIPLAATQVQNAQPDIILAHVGSVDINRGQTAASTATEIETLIGEFRKGNPNVKILLAEVIPFGAGPFFVDVAPLNALLPNLVANLTTAQSPVILIDHFTGWDPNIHSIDTVHPNELGDTRMANTWHDALLALNLRCGASFEQIGAGCAGTAGTPTLNATPGQRPVIGKPFSLTLGSMPQGAPVIGFIGMTDKFWNGAPLPMDLSVILMPGCSLFISPDFSYNLVANQAGSLTWDLPQSSNDPSLAGLEIFFQAAVSDPGANLLGFTTTNAGVATLDLK